MKKKMYVAFCEKTNRPLAVASSLEAAIRQCFDKVKENFAEGSVSRCLIQIDPFDGSKEEIKTHKDLTKEDLYKVPELSVEPGTYTDKGFGNTMLLRFGSERYGERVCITGIMAEVEEEKTTRHVWTIIDEDFKTQIVTNDWNDLKEFLWEMLPDNHESRFVNEVSGGIDMLAGDVPFNEFLEFIESHEDVIFDVKGFEFHIFRKDFN